jgi:folate-binding protein YgfZ
MLATSSGEDEPIFVSENQCVIKHTNEGDYLLCRLPSKLPRYEMIAPLDIMKILWLKISKYFRPITTQAWELLDIQAGIPMVYPETIDQILPHNANLPTLDGVSFNIGCYLGQEIIARMQYKGKIKKHTYRFAIEDKGYSPKVGEPVIEGKTQETRGIVMRHSTSNQFAHELLVVIDDIYAQSQDLFLGNPKGPKLNFLDLPYTW